MGRPLRIEFEGALYHITTRGNEQKDIFLDGEDREKFFEYLQLTKISCSPLARSRWIGLLCIYNFCIRKSISL